MIKSELDLRKMIFLIHKFVFTSKVFINTELEWSCKKHFHRKKGRYNFSSVKGRHDGYRVLKFDFYEIEPYNNLKREP